MNKTLFVKYLLMSGVRSDGSHPTSFSLEGVLYSSIISNTLKVTEKIKSKVCLLI